MVRVFQADVGYKQNYTRLPVLSRKIREWTRFFKREMAKLYSKIGHYRDYV